MKQEIFGFFTRWHAEGFERPCADLERCLVVFGTILGMNFRQT
jgi:hypothetical protein